VRSPKITVTCDCGETRKLDYGESYTCSCGRTWSTGSIPEEEYGQIRSLDRRYRMAGYAAAALFGGLMLAIILTKPFEILFVLPFVMAMWFGFIRPFVRRRHWRQVQQLTRSWKLKPEKPAPQ
jgi:hypothetical protein